MKFTLENLPCTTPYHVKGFTARRFFVEREYNLAWRLVLKSFSLRNVPWWWYGCWKICQLFGLQLGGGNSNIFLFSPRKLGKIFTHFDGSHIFQRGWFNHQLVKICLDFGMIGLFTPLKFNIWNLKTKVDGRWFSCSFRGDFLMPC